jgi:hypothetical protein
MNSDNSEIRSGEEGLSIKVGSFLVKIGNTQYSLPNVALLFMLAGILIPSVVYSLNLKDPTPAELLIAICIALFSSVLFLWILDATSVLRFRSEWIGKSIYGAAIASIIGTSVAVYSDAFSERKYPYEGRWEISISSKESGSYIAKHIAAIVYSQTAETYWGYSDFRPKGEIRDEESLWLNIEDFSPKNGKIKFEMINTANIRSLHELKIKPERHGKMFKGVEQEKLLFVMCRTK